MRPTLWHVTAMTDAPELFRAAVAALQRARTRSEITLEPIRPPQRLAPWSYAIGCELTGPADVSASGRLVLLHDPDGQQGWGGVLRLVLYVSAELDPDLANDPLLASVGWSWLTDALDDAAADATALGGTVTATSSTRFGNLSASTRTDDLELRASWTPRGTELTAHADAFARVMSSVVGLPPVGVTNLGEHQ